MTMILSHFQSRKHTPLVSPGLTLLDTRAGSVWIGGQITHTHTHLKKKKRNTNFQDDIVQNKNKKKIHQQTRHATHRERADER